jgi:hypothetical protein
MREGERLARRVSETNVEAPRRQTPSALTARSRKNQAGGRAALAPGFPALFIQIAFAFIWSAM